MNQSSQLFAHRFLALLAIAFCLLLLVEGLLPQLQMFLLGGQVLLANSLIKILLLATIVLGCILCPEINLSKLPMFMWTLCVVFLFLEIGHLMFAHSMSLDVVLFGYNSYYLLLLIGPAILVFRDMISERVIVRLIVIIFLVCAPMGFAQYATSQPILPTESSDGGFTVLSYQFLGEVRAFSLFGSPMGFGLFSALVGALGIAMSRTMPLRGSLLSLLAVGACFTTLTRLSYLVFACACLSSLILTYGKKPRRDLWSPILYLVLGIATIFTGLASTLGSGASSIQNSASLLDRIYQWTYYSQYILDSNLASQLFGSGLIQNEKLAEPLPMVIDNSPLALIVHIGIVGLVLFSILLMQMWLYLRREALKTRKPLVIAAASLWATLACAGIFNLVFSTFGLVFALIVLCDKDSSTQLKVPDVVPVSQ